MSLVGKKYMNSVQIEIICSPIIKIIAIDTITDIFGYRFTYRVCCCMAHS